MTIVLKRLLVFLPLAYTFVVPTSKLESKGLIRRIAKVSASTKKMEETTAKKRRTYINLTGFPFPLGPFFARKTTRQEIVSGRVWSFEQEQTLLNVRVNTRMVAVKLRSGDLWIYNPIAPTDELIAMLAELPCTGKVGHIVLGTTQYEHKIFAGPFSRRFPEAAIHCVPNQYAFPLDLPPRAVGIIPARENDPRGPGLLREDAVYAWGNEFSLRILRPEVRLAGRYAAVEAAFVHHDSKTLILTDAMVNVPKSPPPVVDESSLFGLGSANTWVLRAAALSNWRGQGEDLRKAVRAFSEEKAIHQDKDRIIALGWRRNALLALTFGPSPDSLINPEPAFSQLADKWLVAPVCQYLVYASPQIKAAVKRWVTEIAKLDFVRVAPAHFAVAQCSPREFKRAFGPLFSEENTEPDTTSLLSSFSFPTPFKSTTAAVPEPDVRLINDLAASLRRVGVI